MRFGEDKVVSSGAGRLLMIPVGDSETAKLSARVIRLLLFDRSYVSVPSLMDRAEMPLQKLVKVVQLLCDYRLAEVKSGPLDNISAGDLP